MPYLPILVFLFLMLPLFGAMFFTNLVTLSFAKLGLTPGGAFALVLLSLVGSALNLPLSRRRVWLPERSWSPFPFVFYEPPRLQEQVLYINVGGAVIPGLFAAYLLLHTPPGPALLATALVALVCYRLARIIPGRGIGMPAFLPPLLAALVALLLAPPGYEPRVAYISGVYGTLIGADLLHLVQLQRFPAQAISIGGAGVFDGIFLVGIVAALIS
ncbi:MAG: DUF1614 domain-containing protein [Firmicutes bacterium]|nr:DUF1614 domain-containing protein [Bacillota bacterium]